MRDPFDTATLRESVLAAWRGSPTRLREDAAVEADLVRAGYRDRALTELAQNAADAAAAAGGRGRMAVCWDATEGRLHVANTGAPLSTTGVQALAALRVSAKHSATNVGRFGVGFTAVLALSDEIEVRSRSGSVRFSAADTAAELARAGITATVRPPVLRLVWPSAHEPAAGWDTEVVLNLRADIDAAALLAAMRAEVVDLLLELPALAAISIDGRETVRTERRLRAPADDVAGEGVVELRVADDTGERGRWWQFRTDHARWLLPYRDDRPAAAGPDVLRAPTRSDEELSLPALLIADVAMQPDRRRMLPGHPLRDIAAGYGDFVKALPPARRPALVPAPGFARSEVDAMLRDAVLRELTRSSWVPVVGGDTRPTRAVVLGDLTDELADLLVDVVADLVIPELSGTDSAAALAQVGVSRIGLARLAELLAGIQRPAGWWGRLYRALEPLVTDPTAVEELGALPVPLTDGRLVTGPRTAVLVETATLPARIDWVRVVHPDAAAPLLARLGARQSTAADLLDDPALRDEIRRAGEDIEGDDELAHAVLALAAIALDAGGPLPAGLAELPLPDAHGDRRPADELLLPDAPLRPLLIEDSPFGTVAADLVARFGPDLLRAVGVGWGFAVLTEEDPTGPDHDLDDEEAWWDGLHQDPPVLRAVRDLDLVDERRWPRALSRLAADPGTAAALTDRDGYTAWWLRRHAHIDGRALGSHRHPDDDTFLGLLPALDHPDVDALRAVLADPERLDDELAQALVDALADPGRSPSPGVVVNAHRLLAAAQIDSDDVALPPMVRAVTGALVSPDRALVLDKPWYAQVIPADRLVVGEAATADRLATLLDLATASEAVHAAVCGVGRRVSWDDSVAGVLLTTMFAEFRSAGVDLELHDKLEVCLSGNVEATVRVPWWVDGTVTHLDANIGLLPR